MTAHIPVEVVALVSLLMACTYQAGRISEREKTAQRRRTATATRYRNQEK
jgi:hypothetical protein